MSKAIRKSFRKSFSFTVAVPTIPAIISVMAIVGLTIYVINFSQNQNTGEGVEKSLKSRYPAETTSHHAKLTFPEFRMWTTHQSSDSEYNCYWIANIRDPNHHKTFANLYAKGVEGLKEIEQIMVPRSCSAPTPIKNKN